MLRTCTFLLQKKKRKTEKLSIQSFPKDLQVGNTYLPKPLPSTTTSLGMYVFATMPSLGKTLYAKDLHFPLTKKEEENRKA